MRSVGALAAQVGCPHHRAALRIQLAGECVRLTLAHCLPGAGRRGKSVVERQTRHVRISRRVSRDASHGVRGIGIGTERLVARPEVSQIYQRTAGGVHLGDESSCALGEKRASRGGQVRRVRVAGEIRVACRVHCDCGTHRTPAAQETAAARAAVLLVAGNARRVNDAIPGGRNLGDERGGRGINRSGRCHSSRGQTRCDRKRGRVSGARDIDVARRIQCQRLYRRRKVSREDQLRGIRVKLHDKSGTRSRLKRIAQRQ